MIMAAKIGLGERGIEHIKVHRQGVLCSRRGGIIRPTRPLADVPVTKICQNCRRIADQITAALEAATS